MIQNLHLVRCTLDEVFGSENFVSQIIQKSSGRTSEGLDAVYDALLWYAKYRPRMKFRKLFRERTKEQMDTIYNSIDLPDGSSRMITADEMRGLVSIPSGPRRFRPRQVSSQTPSESSLFEYELNGRRYRPSAGRGWTTSKEGLDRLAKAERLLPRGRYLAYKLYADDFPLVQIHNIWTDVLFTVFEGH
jgi:adenine-specific DNA-methyltransferase